MAKVSLAGLPEGYKTACFTGPRPNQLFGYYRQERYDIITKALGELLPQLVAQGTFDFISGGAQGFDQLAFWAVETYVHDYDVSNIVYKPFDGQETRWAMRGLFSQEEYGRMLRRATDVVVVHEGEAGDNAIPYLFDRNHKMVDDSDYVIALLADRSLDWQTAKGGTAECVRYARSKNKPVLALRLVDGEISEPVWL